MFMSMRRAANWGRLWTNLGKNTENWATGLLLWQESKEHKERIDQPRFVLQPHCQTEADTTKRTRQSEVDTNFDHKSYWCAMTARSLFNSCDRFSSVIKSLICGPGDRDTLENLPHKNTMNLWEVWLSEVRCFEYFWLHSTSDSTHFNLRGFEDQLFEGAATGSWMGCTERCSQPVASLTKKQLVYTSQCCLQLDGLLFLGNLGNLGFIFPGFTLHSAWGAC